MKKQREAGFSVPRRGSISLYPLLQEYMKAIVMKIVLSVLFITTLISTVPSLVLAQSGLLFGQNHFYSVIFRGNGEAIVYAKLAITNSDNKPQTDFSFEIPGVVPSELAMYQMKLPQECVQTNYNDPKKPCLEYRDPDYAQQYYYYGYSNGSAEYQKVTYSVSGSQYHLTLPTPLDPFKSTAIIVAYAAKGYVSQSAGLSSFTFETIKVPSRVQEVRVAVDVDTDQILKGSHSNVNYGVSLDATVGASASIAISGRSLDTVVGKIGSYGALVKDAKNLSPNESFSVKGEYATSWWRLYLSEMLWTIGIIAVIFAGMYGLIVFLRKRRGRGESPANIEHDTPTASVSLRAGSVLNVTNMWVSLVSVMLIVGLTYGINALTHSDLLQSSGYDPIISIVLFITVILLYALAMLGPAIIVAIKHGWKSFLTILVAEFFWLFIFLVLYFLLFHSSVSPSYVTSPTPID